MQFAFQKKTYGNADQAPGGRAECEQNDQDAKVYKNPLPLGLRQDDGVGCFVPHQTIVSTIGLFYSKADLEAAIVTSSGLRRISK
jgi:hypothetical protein